MLIKNVEEKCNNCKVKLINYEIFIWKSLLYCSVTCLKIHWRFPGFIGKKVYHTYSNNNLNRETHLK